MTIQETINLIQRKVWTVEELSSQLDSVMDNLGKLSNEHRKRIPVFPSDWSEAGVKKYVKDIEKAVNEPIKYMNRRKLEEIGVKTEGVAEEVLGNTRGIGEILSILGEIKSISVDMNEKLLTDSMVTKWLREGIDVTKQKLQEINDAKPAFKRLAESEVDTQLRTALIEKALLDTGSLSRCEDIISKSKYLQDFEITLQYRGDFEKFCANVDEVCDKIRCIQDEFGISIEQLTGTIKNKELSDLGEILDKDYYEYDKEKRKLTDECNMYSYTLSSIGQDVPEIPESLLELRTTVEHMKQKCLEYLGESGLALINFMKEGGEFPTQVGIEEIKRTLEILRPFFMKVLEREA
ncbi:MAG: hypothetical protein ACTSRU_19205 [Candidatus Hodarchaeales archaeon]